MTRLILCSGACSAETEIIRIFYIHTEKQQKNISKSQKPEANERVKEKNLKCNFFFCMGQVEDLLVAMEKVKQELEVMKAKLSSTQLSLAEKEGHLTALRAERRKHLEEVLEMK